jgi:hypothetical protein
VSVPRWVGRLIWAFRGKRAVRLHLEVQPHVAVSTVEGILVGRWSGHYVLLLPKVAREGERSIPLEGTLEVPAERVVLVQVLPS